MASSVVRALEVTFVLMCVSGRQCELLSLLETQGKGEYELTSKEIIQRGKGFQING